MNIWKNVCQDTHHRKLTAIGEIWWWSEDAAMKKIFGNLLNPESALNIDVVITFDKIKKNCNLNTDIHAKVTDF